jgi:hypothetical protein
MEFLKDLWGIFCAALLFSLAVVVWIPFFARLAGFIVGSVAAGYREGESQDR